MSKEPSEPPEDHREFTEWFMHEFRAQLNRTISRRLIPNRYTRDDVKNYMAERIIDILEKRKAKGNPIREPKVYFRKLVPFWCVEFQRMHGFIYSLPKRPRCVEAEKIISKFGFVYLKTDYDQGFEDSAFYASTDHITKTSYIDTRTTEPIMYFHEYSTVGVDPDFVTDTWSALTGALTTQEAAVITCLYRYNLTVPQAARELGIAVSTAYQRKKKALYILSGYIESNTDLKETSWQILGQLTEDDHE